MSKILFSRKTVHSNKGDKRIRFKGHLIKNHEASEEAFLTVEHVGGQFVVTISIDKNQVNDDTMKEVAQAAWDKLSEKLINAAKEKAVEEARNRIQQKI